MVCLKSYDRYWEWEKLYRHVNNDDHDEHDDDHDSKGDDDDNDNVIWW